MKKVESLKTYRDFQRVYSQKKSCGNRYLVMYLMQNGREDIRVGISVSKKVGNSVVRHRVTRLIRESIRLNQDKCKTGYDIVFVARPMAKGQGFTEIESAMLHLMKLHDIYEESK